VSDEEREPTLREVLNVILQHNSEFNRRTTRLENHVVKLWKHVNGAPPAGDDSLPPPTGGPLEAQVSSHSLELEALRGDVLQVKQIAAGTQAETTKQSDFFGIGVRGVRFLMSPAGRKSMVGYMTAFGALLAAAASAYNMIRGGR
jgi:hypothetical protein